MKKHIYSVLAFAVFAASAFASPATELDVKVPFEFKAGASTLPAGTYRVTETGSGYVLIRGEKGGIFVNRSDVSFSTDGSGKPSFKFNRAGDSYILQSVHSEK
jgi:hypothetical protein